MCTARVYIIATALINLICSVLSIWSNFVMVDGLQGIFYVTCIFSSMWAPLYGYIFLDTNVSVSEVCGVVHWCIEIVSIGASRLCPLVHLDCVHWCIEIVYIGDQGCVHWCCTVLPTEVVIAPVSLRLPIAVRHLADGSQQWRCGVSQRNRHAALLLCSREQLQPVRPHSVNSPHVAVLLPPLPSISILPFIPLPHIRTLMVLLARCQCGFPALRRASTRSSQSQRV